MSFHLPDFNNNDENMNQVPEQENSNKYENQSEYLNSHANIDHHGRYNFVDNIPRGGIPNTTVYYGGGLNQYSSDMKWIIHNIRNFMSRLASNIEYWETLGYKMDDPDQNKNKIIRQLRIYDKILGDAMEIDMELAKFFESNSSRSNLVRHTPDQYRYFKNKLDELYLVELEIEKNINYLIKNPQFAARGFNPNQNILSSLRNRATNPS
jgi:hypothetical protein